MWIQPNTVNPDIEVATDLLQDTVWQRAPDAQQSN